MAKTVGFDFSHLSPAERIQLAHDLLESVEPDAREWSLTDAQKAELQRRLDEYDRDPEAGESWEDLRDELLGKLGLGNASAA
jgi:putative addiction module component (TIGR02574 family)